MQENHSFDQIAGGLNYTTDIDGLIFQFFCNPTNTSIPLSMPVCALPIAANVAPNDPMHGVGSVSYELYSTFCTNETAIDFGSQQLDVDRGGAGWAQCDIRLQAVGHVRTSDNNVAMGGT